MTGTGRFKSFKNVLFGLFKETDVISINDGDHGEIRIDNQGNLRTSDLNTALAAYALNDLEDLTPLYIGMSKPNGVWLMKKYSDSAGTMLYANRSCNLLIADYVDAWSSRSTLEYKQIQFLTGV